MTVKIENHAPPPPPTVGRPRRYPFPNMAVGDSFAVPLDGNTTGEDRAAVKLRGSAIRYAGKHGGKFTVRIDREAGEVRCWRIA